MWLTQLPLCCSQEYINDYGDDELKALGEKIIARESGEGLSDGAKKVLDRKLKKVNEGERDLYL